MKLSKILKKLDAPLVETMNAADEAALKTFIAQSEEAIASATRARDANTKYQAAKQAVKDLSEGLKEVKGFQTAKIQYALRRLRELSGEVLEDEES